MPGGSFSSYALSSDLCSAHSSSSCGSGGLWNVKGAQDGIGYPISYEPAIDFSATSGLYMTGQVYAQNLNIGSSGNTQTATNASLVAVDVGNQTLPNGNQIDLEVGALALGADDQQQVFTTGSSEVGEDAIDAWIFPGYLYNKSLAQSYSFSLHIGSTAFDYPGSMYFGGYDKGRAIGPGTTFSDSPPQLQDIVIGVETGGSPFNFDSKKGLLLTNTSQNEPIAVSPEPLVPYLFLPKQTCDKIASQLPVTFDSSGYYLWDTNDASYANITTSAAYLGFVFPPATGGTSDVTIKVPFQLLVLNLTQAASGKPGNTPYFPCMATSDGTYYLGRAFLQAAFYGRNWNRHVSWLAQAPGPGDSKSGLGSEPMDIQDADTNLKYYEGDSYFADSWSSYWSPLPGTADDSNIPGSGSSSDSSSGLSTGAKAGIGVGAAAVGVALLAVIAWFFTRRRKQQKEKVETASGNEPFVGGDNANGNGTGAAAYYGSDAKAHPQSYHAVNQYDHSPQHGNDWEQIQHAPQYDQGRHGYYQPGADGYTAYKPPMHDSYQMNELSGTIRSPAHELPGHEPSEMEAPGPKFVRQPER